MIYFLYGDQPTMINKKIKTIAKESLLEQDELSLVRFDGNDTLVQDVIDECDYLPLGYDHKVVVLFNAYFLLKGKSKNKIESEQNYDKLVNYIKNPNPQTEFIITVNSLDIDDKNEIVKLLKENASILIAKFPEKEEFHRYIYQYVTKRLKVSIDNDAVRELADRCDGDVALMQNNADKLALYTDKITYNDVCDLVVRPLEDNTFQLFNFLVDSQKQKALNLYRDLKAQNVEPVVLISQLEGQFRLLNEVAYLAKQGQSDDEIATELSIKPVRARIIKKSVYKVSETTLHKTLEDLYQLDLQIKSGLVDRFYAFELFLINFKAA